jgi:hypothetical protein
MNSATITEFNSPVLVLFSKLVQFSAGASKLKKNGAQMWAVPGLLCQGRAVKKCCLQTYVYFIHIRLFVPIWLE